MQAQSNSQKPIHRKSPGPSPTAPTQNVSPENGSLQRPSSSSSKLNNNSRRQNAQLPNSPPLSQIEKSVTHLLVATKQLLETLTQWSRKQATEAQVSDVYVRLGYEFNIACRAFTAINVETSDLGNVPELLRTILESTLSQQASVESLEKYLPRIRDIIINLLHGLKRKQQKLRHKQAREQNGDSQIPRNVSVNSVGSAGTSLTTLLDHGLSDNFQRNGESRSTAPTNEFSRGSSSSSHRRGMPNRDQVRSDSSTSNTAMQNSSAAPHPNSDSDITMRPSMGFSEGMVNSFPPPPPPKISTNALAALQRGGELERRASKRYSAYQISKHLGAPPNGVPMLPQNSPVPNRGRNDAHESIRAVHNRVDNRNMRQQPSSFAVQGSPNRVPNRTTDEGVKPSENTSVSTQGERPTAVVQEKLQQTAPNTNLEPIPPDTKSTSSVTLPTEVQNAQIQDPKQSSTSRPPKPNSSSTNERSLNSDVHGYTTDVSQKELTLFLQYKTKIKKFVLTGGYSDLSVARLQLAFIEKFAWNTHHNGVDLPEIYIQDAVSGVRHELEDLSDIKDRSVLVLNIEALDEVKRHIDEGLGEIKNIVEDVRTAVDDQQANIQRVSDRQQETAKELSRIAATASSAPREVNSDMINNTLTSPRKVDSQAQQREVHAIRRDLAVVRQTYSAFQSDVQNSMNMLRKTAENVKAAAAKASLPDMTGDSGRSYVNKGKKSLDEDSDKLVAQVDDLQDMVEDLRKDVVLRGVRPLPRQLDTVAKDISQAGFELKKMQDFLKHERPIWTKIWEKELERVCKDREDMTLIEDLIIDLEDDLSKASQTFALVEEATKEQLKDSPSSIVAGRALSRGLTQIVSSDPAAAKEGVLDEVRALQPNHENRLEAIERAEKLRQKELESRRDGEFQRELGSFVEEGKLKKSGGFEEVERARKLKDERIRMEVWERQNGMTQADTNHEEIGLPDENIPETEEKAQQQADAS
ncbi:hypothetical protein K3495_g6737 [Podosphaera aphanis]|nr:hypothetical protein K3495_g6737 [Podosphaera aphanis]